MDGRLRGRDAGVNITNGVKTTVTIFCSHLLPHLIKREQMRAKNKKRMKDDSSMPGWSHCHGNSSRWGRWKGTIHMFHMLKWGGKWSPVFILWSDITNVPDQSKRHQSGAQRKWRALGSGLADVQRFLWKLHHCYRDGCAQPQLAHPMMRLCDHWARQRGPMCALHFSLVKH